MTKLETTPPFTLPLTAHDCLIRSPLGVVATSNTPEQAAALVHRTNLHEELCDTLQSILLRAVRQQASGGGLMTFQDALRECADQARAALARARDGKGEAK